MRALIDDYKFLFTSDKRLRQRRKIAKDRRWKYISRRKFRSDPIALFDFELYNGTSEKRLKSIIYIPLSKKGASMRVYDYAYFGDLRQRTTTVFEYYDGTINLPHFTIHPKGTSDTFKKIFGEEAMVIRTATPDFLNNYNITTAHDFKLKETITEEFLDEIGDNPGWNFEGISNCIISYKRNQIVENNVLVDQIISFVRIVEGLQNGRTFIK